MKKAIIVLIIFVFVRGIFSQDFKPVQTAQDVIDNYITANGGEANLRNIKSIKVTGSFNMMGKDAPIDIYMAKGIMFMSFKAGELSITSAMDKEHKIGWSKFGDKIQDLQDNEIAANETEIESTLWGYYTDKAQYGISYDLLQNEKVADKDAYVIDFKKKDSVITTVYFDTKTFLRVKEVKSHQSSEYTDNKIVGSSGVYMPYDIKSEQGDFKITEYTFNSKLNKKLLEKPETK